MGRQVGAFSTSSTKGLTNIPTTTDRSQIGKRKALINFLNDRFMDARAIENGSPKTVGKSFRFLSPLNEGWMATLEWD